MNNYTHKYLKALTFICTVFFATGLVRAEDHALSTIQGTQIDLKSYDHAFAGSIKDFVAWGSINEEAFTSNLIMRKDGQDVLATFKKNDDGTVGGAIHNEVGDKKFDTKISLVKVVPSESKIILNINVEEVAVEIKADSFSNGHFQNPTYSSNYKGEKVFYTLKGQDCFGYSTHLAFLILGAYLH